MKLHSIKVENFKAIKTAKIPTSSGLTVIVGQNSSGKSSVLQAIHWACRSVANSRIQNNQSRSVAVHEFDYYPTENTRLVGNNKELRQARGGNDEISVSIEFEHSKEHESSTKKSKVLISQGNNDAVKIDLRNNAIDKDFYEVLSDMQHPFSSYIPGLAGIPLSEEKRSRQPVLRQAASGAANTVLRNILEQIREDKRESVSLEKLSQLCSKVLGDTHINVDFRPESDFNIKATIKTNDMSEGYTAPLEMAGTGVLQCIQIFSYILLYQPKLLLIDEPDAHLHPDRQEKLALALSEISKETETSIIITTHSPNLVRALPSECKLIWMKSGEIAETGDSVRKKMGWGILDKKILLITEDSHPTELKSILNQWPDLSRHVAVWPVSGHRSLPTKDACKSLLEMTGMQKIIIHRDGDFMTPDERKKLEEKYNSEDTHLWITDDSDIEAFFLDPYRVSKVSGIPYEEIESIYKEIKEEYKTEFDDVFAQKRQEIAEDRRIYESRDNATKVASAKEKIPDGHAGIGKIHGKLFSRKLKAEINSRKCDPSKILTTLPDEVDLAKSLREVIEKSL